MDTAVVCPTCSGSCCRPGTSPRTCEVCGGRGSVQRVARSFLGQVMTTQPCAACHGFGTVIPEPCTECSGEGRVRSRRTLSVDVPAGVDTGTRIKLTGQGEVGPAGGPAGDVYLEVRERKHDTFVRRGDDLHATLEVPMTAAALGTVLMLDTLDGPREVDLRPGTQPSQIVSLKGLGVGHLHAAGRGDLHVHVEVHVPTAMDDEQAELLRKLAALRGEERPEARLVRVELGRVLQAARQALGPLSVTMPTSRVMSAPVFLAEPGTLDGVDRRAPRTSSTAPRAGTRAWCSAAVPASGSTSSTVPGCASLGVVGAVTAEGVLVHVQQRVVEPAPAVALVLVQALAKGDRDEMAIEAATEVGVDAVVPWQAERSIVVWRGDRAAKSRARWLGTVRAAAKQSRRARVPDVEVALDGRGLVERVRAVVAAGGVGAGAARGRQRAASRRRDCRRPGECLVVVGPEGGIGDGELGRLVEAGARAVRLGPHVLRTSTAGPVALAMLAERLGRWG